MPPENQKGIGGEEQALLSLDDAAALLVQLEPTDLTGLARVRECLSTIASQESFPTLVRKRAGETAQRIEEVTQGTSGDPCSTLSEAGRLIGAAMDAMEEEKTDQQARELTPQNPQEQWLPADADPSLLGEFIIECREYIEGAEAALLSLETNPEDSESINTVFRAFHTIKGTSAFLGITFLSELAHRAESLLSRIRDREIRCTGGYADLVLRSVDMLKDLIQSTQDALGGQPLAKPANFDDLIYILTNPQSSGISDQADEATAAPPRLGDILVAEGKADREAMEAVAAVQGQEPIGLAILKSKTASLTDVAQALRRQQQMAGAGSVESSVRVRTDRLDRLIDMIGELVIAYSMIAQDGTVLHGKNHDLGRKVTHAGKIVRELQDLSMTMRMVPLKTIFQKMARLVRDLAHKSGKDVAFITEGEETEIDRNMVDLINDPLVHMVRNAVDHGIESPDVRGKNGKSRTGTVRLAAYHSGGNVVVELQDDGKGLDRDKIIQKAIAKGLLTSDKDLPDSGVFNLIFEPGFSTAEKVTDVSGRGVGMDVVRRNIEALRGRIDIASQPGKGCTFSLRLPLTLAITDGMLVKVGAERFILPTVNIYISFRPDAEALSTIAGRGEMVMLRGELMPIVRLHRLFHIRGAIEDPTKGLLVIVDGGDRHCALLVDELLGQQQVVAKSLGSGIGKIQGISGGAILGDGRVGLILDPSGIAALARQASDSGNGNGSRRGELDCQPASGSYVEKEEIHEQCTH